MARPDPRDVLKLYEQAKSLRSVHENDWRMASAYCLPSHYSAWQTDGPAKYTPGNGSARRVQFDSTGTRSLPKYVSILERIATPVGQRWHGLVPSDANLRKSQRVREYFDTLQDMLFRYRYDSRARFRIATSELYTSMGVYGNGPVFIGQRAKSSLSPTPGFKYIACPLRDIFFLIDDDGEVTAVFRRFWLNARQFKLKFPNDTPPASVELELKKATPDEGNFFEFVHYVAVRSDFDAKALDARRHPVLGSYLSVKDQTYVGDESGFRSMPYKIPRTLTVAGDPYGYSPAVQALAALGSASQVKKTYLKQGNKAVDPALAAFDDGMVNGEIDQRPGAMNYGLVDKQGRMLIHALPTGNFSVAETILQDERRDIEDSFFVTLFQILTDTPQMTATEVMERVAEKASLLSPTMGRLQSEFLAPTIEREIDILDELGVLPPMPPELVEAKGDYDIVYTSPMAKGMYAEEVSGFMRSVEMALNVAQATQDPSHLDHFDFDTAIPEISDYMAVPARWMNDPDKVASKRDERGGQAQDAALMKNAPALASAVKTVSDMQQPKGKQ